MASFCDDGVQLSVYFPDSSRLAGLEVLEMRSLELCDSLGDANAQPGIVAALSAPVADAPSSAVLALSTFSTDYLLLPKDESFEAALAALGRSFIVWT